METNFDEIQIDYSSELKSDSTIEVAKEVCYLYLEEDQIKYSLTELEYLINFCQNKFIEINKIKKQMKIKNYSHSCYEISCALDRITLGNSILEEENITNYIILTKDINNLLFQLRFCVGVLYKMINEKSN